MDVDTLLGKAGEVVSVGRAFGPPIERDGVVVIPVAWVAGGGGGGAGPTPGAGTPNTGEGGGFGGLTWPLGVYVVKDGSVRWVPAIDATLIVLAVVALARSLTKLRRVRRVKGR